MKKTNDMRFFTALIFCFCSLGSWAQLVQLPIVHKAMPQKKANQSTRIQSQPALKLPFWDDFSFNNPHHVDSVANYPYDSLWQYAHSVTVNTGMAINAPTINVATFDGVDSLGFPYSISNAYAKGIADRMISRKLRMDLVAPTDRDSVFIYFQYQFEGNGEPPDPGDSLSLWFRNGSGNWNWKWSVAVDTTSDKTKFIPVKIYVKDTSFFHSNFQFRFQNYARLSGPFDTWNLDYVYVSNGRKQYVPVLSDFPDRAISSPLSSLFSQYQSIPVWHFLNKPDSMLVHPTILVSNLRKDLQQPVSLDATLSLATRLNGVTTKTTLPYYSATAQIIFYGAPVNFSLDTTLTYFNSLDPKIDSMVLKMNTWVTTKDNEVKIGTTAGDYDTLVYKGIDFRHNDTTSTNFTLKNYYAYDDSKAEYAVTLTQPGASLAYRFDMAYPKTDTLIAVDIYFPHVGDESNQVVQLRVMDTLTNSISNILQQQDLVISRTENNLFTRVKLGQAVAVKKTFYIGWKQNSSATIGVGFDKDSDSGSKIYSNISGDWIQNIDLHGNLMIRPVFGRGKVIVTGITEGKKTFAYPNPNKGLFYLPKSIQGLQVIDLAGRAIPFTEESMIEQTQVTLSNSSTGLFIARYFLDGKWHAEKIMVSER